MITVERTRHIDASPEAIFNALSDPAKLAALLPRVQRVEFIDRGADRARIATYMALGPFGNIRSEGELTWQDNREVVFSARKPVTVQSRWTLVPANGGTDVHASLSLDLAPLIGLFASFVPPDQVKQMIEPDLELALTEIANRVGLRERVVNA
jgi:carbon monoxide dehydrogenase subunit G